MKSSVHAATKLLHFKPHKLAAVQEIQDAGCAERVWFYKGFNEAACSCEADPLLTYFTDEA
jgi:hypothetical protein